MVNAKLNGTICHSEDFHYTFRMETSQYLENQVLSMPNLQPRAPTSELFSRFLNEIAPSVRLLPPVATTLEFFGERDRQLARIADAYRCFPAVNKEFIQYIRHIRDLKEDKTQTEDQALDQAIAIFGLDNAKHLLICIDLLGSIQKKPIRWWNGRTAKIEFESKRVLRYANKSYEQFEHANRFPYRVFAAGLVFDGLRIYAETAGGGRKTATLEYIEGVYNQGEQIGQVVNALAKEVKMIELGEFAIASAILSNIGKVVMAILDPTYIQFATLQERTGLARPLRIFSEKKRYGVSHNFFGYLLCGTFNMFRPVAEAILYSHEPYIPDFIGLKSTYEIASTVSLAGNIISTQSRLPGEVKIDSKFASETQQTNNRALMDQLISRYWLGNAFEHYDLPLKRIHEIVQTLRGD
jgi:hypothetical protein